MEDLLQTIRWEWVYIGLLVVLLIFRYPIMWWAPDPVREMVIDVVAGMMTSDLTDYTVKCKK